MTVYRRKLNEVLTVRYGKALPASERDDEGRWDVVGSAGKITGTATPLSTGPTLVVGRKGSVGSVHLLPNGGWPIDTTYYASIPEHLEPAFLAYQLQVLGLERLDSSTAVPSLRRQDLERQRIWEPPLEEQRRIVEILEDHLSRLDAAAIGLDTANRRMARLLERLADQHVEQMLCEAGVRPLADLASSVVYGTSAKTGALSNETDVPVLRMGNIVAGQLDWSALKYLPADHADVLKLDLRQDDLLFNRTNSAELVGKSAVFNESRPATFASYLIRVRFTDPTDSHWAALVINSPYGRRYINSVASQQVGQSNVNGTKLKAFPIPSGDSTLRDRLVREFAEESTAARHLRSAIDTTLDRGRILRRAVLAAAFSGKLTGRRTDDEVIEELAQ